MERTPKENRFEFVVLAGKRARQLLAGAVPRETGEKKITIAQREVLRRKVVKVEDGGPETFYRRDSTAKLDPCVSSAKKGTLRQQMTTLYRRSGSVYLMKRDVVVEQRALYGDDVRGYVCAAETAFNIDSEFDWALTEAWIAWQEHKHVRGS